MISQHKRNLVAELATGFLALAILIFMFRSLLITGASTFTHDIFHWIYPIFQYFSESISQGYYPLWNPFDHAGEPFFPEIASLLLDPIGIVIISIASHISSNITIWFNWTYFAQLMIMVLGMYLCLRIFAKALWIRLSLIPILLFSGVILSSFRTDAVRNFIWIPYISMILYRIFFKQENRWSYWLLLGALFGLHWQSYHFVGVSVFLLFFLVALAVFYRSLLISVIRTKGTLLKITTALIIALGMMLPELCLFFEQSELVFPVRMVKKHSIELPLENDHIQFENSSDLAPGDVKLTYKAIRSSGTFVTIADFAHMLSPSGKSFYIPPKEISTHAWGVTSEANLYCGILVFVLAMVGLLTTRHALKKMGLVLLVGFGLYIIGPQGGLHWLLFQFYPPVRFDRHTFAYANYFLFGVLFFYVEGCNYLLKNWRRPGIFRLNSSPDFIGTSLLVVIFLLNLVNYVYDLQIQEVGAHFQDWPRNEATRVWVLNNCFFGLLVSSALCLCRKGLGKKWLLVNLVGTLLFWVLALSRERMVDAGAIALILGIPLTGWVLARNIRLSKKCERWRAPVLSLVFVAILSGDLLYVFNRARFVFQGQPSHHLACGIDTQVHALGLPLIRQVAPAECLSETTDQLRYGSIAFREPSALSTPFHKKSATSFADVLRIPRVNTFFFLNKYFELIHTDIEPALLSDIFTVGSPMFQYRRGAVFSKDDEIKSVLASWGPSAAARLKSYVFSEDSSFSGTHVDLPKGGVNDDENFRVNLRLNGYNEYCLDVDSNQAGLLYWADGYDRWWKAFVQGQAVPIHRVNMNFKAVEIPKGHSVVRFIYDPAFFKVSLLAFYLLFFASVGMALFIWWSRSGRVYARVE